MSIYKKIISDLKIILKMVKEIEEFKSFSMVDPINKNKAIDFIEKTIRKYNVI